MTTSPISRLWRNNSLSLVLIAITLLALTGHFFAGLGSLNDELKDLHQPTLSAAEYWQHPHFWSSIFENWESEFLQIGSYVWLTVFLRQLGSSESKSPDTPAVEGPGEVKPDSPWPVRRGGWVLKLYENSLTLAFLFLFITSFLLHAYTSAKNDNAEQARLGLPGGTTMLEMLRNAEFWFESMQNWQSEFLSILAVVVLSIFLRQRGSPESKKVETPNWENEE